MRGRSQYTRLESHLDLQGDSRRALFIGKLLGGLLKWVRVKRAHLCFISVQIGFHGARHPKKIAVCESKQD